MPDNIIERVTKIKELPIKESVSDDLVMLVEDLQDTKQMSVKLFLNILDNASDHMVDMVNAKLAEVDAILQATSFDKIDQIVAEVEANEEIRQQQEANRQFNEEQRQQKMTDWTTTIDAWLKTFQQWTADENNRKSNENYRIEKFNE